MKTTATKTISIVVPALNEAGSIRQLIKRVDTALSSIDYSYELIVVDDHSTDRTATIVRRMARDYPVRVITKVGAKGKAQALLEGFAAAKYELVAMIDADLQYPPEALIMMLEKLEHAHADVVLTRRADNETSILRRFISVGFNLIVARALHGVSFDTQSGLKLFRRNLLSSMTLKPSPWSFDLEFIVRARQSGAVFAEVPITFAKRLEGEAKINVVKASYEVGLASIKLKRDLIREHNYKLKGYQS